MTKRYDERQYSRDKAKQKAKEKKSRRFQALARLKKRLDKEQEDD